MILRIARYNVPPIGTGSDNPNWKGGMPTCLDCGKTLTQRTYRRCGICARKGDLNPYRQKIIKENGSIGCYEKIKKAIRNSYLYRQWRSDVYTRDDFTCQKCFKRGVKLEAHHIVSLASIIRKQQIETIKDALVNPFIFDINNGKTLCVDCHKETANYKGKNHKLLKDIKGA